MVAFGNGRVPAGSEDRSRAVLVIGPGRSGTSVTMRALNLLGVDAGAEERLVGPGPGGPKGFWERRDVTELNERLLRAMGGSWRRPPRLDPGWEESSRLDGLRDEARRLIGEFEGSALWGWKDPRASLTLPLWRPLLAAAGCEARYVICVRNPLDVAASIAPGSGEREFLFSRRGPSPARALPLWGRYVGDALANTAGCPRLVVAHEDWFENRPRTVRRLAGFAGCDPPPPGSEGRIERFVEEGLWHHRTPVEQVWRDPRVPAEVRDLYATVMRLHAVAAE